MNGVQCINSAMIFWLSSFTMFYEGNEICMFCDMQDNKMLNEYATVGYFLTFADVLPTVTLFKGREWRTVSMVPSSNSTKVSVNLRRPL